MVAVGVINLCPPALFYLLLSILALIIMSLQNLAGKSVYCLGEYNCNVSSVKFIFLIKIIYVLFWTWILNIICKYGYSSISWFLVFVPFIFMFIILLNSFFFNFNLYNYLMNNVRSNTLSNIINGPSQSYRAINNYLYY
jgi:hypothetical protein